MSSRRNATENGRCLAAHSFTQKSLGAGNGLASAEVQNGRIGGVNSDRARAHRGTPAPVPPSKPFRHQQAARTSA
jgi:hypothetical protein